MSWMQQIFLALVTSATASAAPVDPCAPIVHQPAPDVAYQPDPGVSADDTPQLSVDVEKLQVPVVVDVLTNRAPLGQNRVLGETSIGSVNIVNGKAVLHGAAINGGRPIALSPTCLERRTRITIQRPEIERPRSDKSRRVAARPSVLGQEKGTAPAKKAVAHSPADAVAIARPATVSVREIGRRDQAVPEQPVAVQGPWITPKPARPPEKEPSSWTERAWKSVKGWLQN